MIPIPPHVTDAGQVRRTDSPARSVPPVLDASVNIDHGVTLDISPPVGESATEGRARDALNRSVSDINQARGGKASDAAQTEAAAELSKMPPALAERMGKLLVQLTLPDLASANPIPWPTADGSPYQQSGALASDPGQGLQQLRQQLIDSPMFDMRRLLDRFVPAAGAEQATLTSDGTAADLSKEANEDSPALNSRQLSQHSHAENLQSPRLDPAQLRESLRLLMHGQILWEGELAPGAHARVEREDGWEADPHEPGKMVKGAALNIELTLPNIGTIRVRGLQIKDSIEVAIEVNDTLRKILDPQMNALQENLQQAGLSQVRPRIVES